MAEAKKNVRTVEDYSITGLTRMEYQVIRNALYALSENHRGLVEQGRIAGELHLSLPYKEDVPNV